MSFHTYLQKWSEQVPNGPQIPSAGSYFRVCFGGEWWGGIFKRDGTWIGLGDELDGHLQTEMMAGRKAGDPRSFRRPNWWRSFKQRDPGSWVFFKGYMEISRGDKVESFPSLTDVNMHSCQFSTLAPRTFSEIICSESTTDELFKNVMEAPNTGLRCRKGSPPGWITDNRGLHFFFLFLEPSAPY